MSKSINISRRSFLKKSLVAAAGASLAPTAASAINVIGANEQVNVAVVGIHGRGQAHIKQFCNLKNVHVKTLCDPDERLFADRANMAEELQGSRPGTEVDVRRVLDDPEIDAISVATPDHWHALATIWACQAGKHVYCEKPAYHNISEGSKMVDAARKYNRVVQVGFQRRSLKKENAAIKFLHAGGIGDIYMARGLCYKPRGNIGSPPNQSVPTGFDYNLWVGPAPKIPYNPNYVHYNWHWYWPFGNGDTANQGPHQFDIARWGLGKQEAPVKVSSMGGYYGFDSSQETPNIQTCSFQYADGTILEFETRGLLTNGEFSDGAPGRTIGNFFYGSKGVLQLEGDGKWKTWKGREYTPGPSSGETSQGGSDAMDLTGSGGERHFANFISAVRSGDREGLNCDIQVGHRSTMLPLLANISYRVDRELKFDGSNERFVDDKEANNYLTKNYRKPFVVPDRV